MGCDNCADLGFTDDAGKVICPECNGTGNVTAQREADRELGRMVRALYERNGRRFSMQDMGYRIEVCGMYTESDTIDEAVRKALEAK